MLNARILFSLVYHKKFIESSSANPTVEEKLTLCSFHMPRLSCVGASTSLCV